MGVTAERERCVHTALSEVKRLPLLEHITAGSPRQKLWRQAVTFAEFGPGELERAGVKFVRVRQKHGIPELRIARLHARHVARRL